MAEKAVNYTPDMIASMLDMWENPAEGETKEARLERIAEKLGRPSRSVRAKLVTMGVYKAEPKPLKRAAEGPSKKELLNLMADLVPFDVSGLEPANKSVLNALLEFIQEASQPSIEQTE